jgi:transposase
VFIDETCATTAVTRRYGWGPTADRVTGRVPHGHWEVVTFGAAPPATGLGAPVVVDGAITGELFRAHVEQILVGELRPGDLVVMDDLPRHEVGGVAEVAYLPPYGPDLNPIGQAFRKLKAELRRREERTVDRLEAALGESLEWFSPDDCQSYFRDAGYNTLRGT